jgi:hypothetical protein
MQVIVNPAEAADRAGILLRTCPLLKRMPCTLVSTMRAGSGPLAGRRLSLPDTTETRTINVKLKRKLPAEKVEHFGHEDDEAFYTLRRKAARWAGDNARALKQARPADNRPADDWRVLLGIADLAGGRYPGTARATAVRLSRQP